MYPLSVLSKTFLWLLFLTLFIIGSIFFFTPRLIAWDYTFFDQLLTPESHIPVLEEIEEYPSEATVSASLVASRDARALLVANFIERNDSGKNSPLQPYLEYGQLFVDVADEFGLDFRLLPAIARKESTFCKSNIGRTYYNCFGYGVPASGITEAGKFTSYEEGFRVVASSLKRSYLDKGLTDPIAIMQKYCPPCFAAGGTWANHLNQWLAEMRYDDKSVSADQITNTDLTEFVE
ncbi:glucosaminidase domain-containing protein [Microgenomates group bacterium]|nr:glucosaminidase domain-containing protein [Microgenomates group bacterium]